MSERGNAIETSTPIIDVEINDDGGGVRGADDAGGVGRAAVRDDDLLWADPGKV